MKKKINIVWFRNDLRVSDQSSLAKAFQEDLPVLGVYCLDPRQFQETKYGFKKTEKFRAKFLLETLSNLKSNLKKLHVNLQIHHEKPNIAFQNLAKEFDIQHIFCQKEWTQEEKDIQNEIRSSLDDIQFKESYDQFLFHQEDVPYSNYQQIPEVYTHFRKACEKKSEVRKLQPALEPKPEHNFLGSETKIPNLKDLGFEEFETDSRSAFPFQGGENQAWKRIQHYFWETKKLQYYKKTRNGLLGADYSSKLSAWLANGSISARQIYWEVKKFEKEVKKNQDTYWLIFELIWRDYFKYVSLKHGNKIFQLGGILNKDYKWGDSQKAFKQWVNGQTPEPFVNANMIEIRETGFMSNRGRQNVNSYWAKEWKQDWRIGAAYFEAMLVDYDVHSNWGNWMYNSGVGNDPRDRKFNIKSQADRYDSNGKYQRTWLQESLF